MHFAEQLISLKKMIPMLLKNNQQKESAKA